MADILKRFAKKVSLSTYILSFLYMFFPCILCNDAGKNTYLRTITIGDHAMLDCNYSSENVERLWLYNNNVTLFRNKLRLQETFGNSLELLRNYSLVITNVTLDHEGLYQCFRELQAIVNHTLSVEVLPEVNVSITDISDATIIATNRFIEVTCIAKGSKPAVNLTWLLNDDKVDPTLKQTHRIFTNAANNKTFDTVATLNFQPKVSPLNITCVVHGFRRTRYHHVGYNADYEKRNRFMIGFGIGVLMVISCALGFFIRRSYSVGSATLNNLPATDEKRVNIRDYNCSSHYQDLIRTDAVDPFDGTFGLRNEKGDNIPTGDDTVSLEKLHGEGMVTYWRANTSSPNTKHNILLRKCLSENAALEERAQFQDLAIRLMSMSKHRNIVETIKITTKVPYYIYQEYIDTGNLKDFLSKNLQPSILYDNDDSNEAKEIQRKLAKFVLDILDAMMFLSKEKLRHPALSARKVLLDSLFRCKLYDFWPKSLCISRIQHIIQKPSPPIAWLAPETSSSLLYSEKSDVWSFATLLWEMYSFGGIPYERMTSGEIGVDLKRSMYLNQPDFCPSNLYDVMLVSWRMSPEERPSFDSIQKILNNTKEFMDENAYTSGISSYFVLSEDNQDSENVYG